MKIQKLIYSLFCTSLFVSFFQIFAACNPGSSGNSIATAPGTCVANQAYTQYGCLSTTSCSGGQIGYGYNPTTNQCYPPIPYTGTSLTGYGNGQIGQWNGTLTQVNQGVFTQFLQAAGTCNQYNIANWGGANCNKYTPAGYISMLYQGGATVIVQIMAGVSNPTYINLMNVATGGMGTYGGYGNGTLTVTSNLTIIPSGNGYQLVDPYAGSGLFITDTNETLASINMTLNILYANQTLAIAHVLK